jgi:hypothetical protein
MDPDSDSDFEVPEAGEHLAGEASGLGQKTALLTAMLATVGAIVSYQSASAQSEAMYLKNQSILRQAEASDAWSYYQAKSVKSQIDAATATLAPDAAVRARFLAHQAEEDAGRAKVQAQAQQLQAQARRFSDEAEAKVRPHHRLALAQTFIQIGIAIAAITALSRRAWLLWGSLGCAVTGIALALSAFLL